ncbi:MAG: TAT-variant-translocated molybdopterin oxidoreductase [Deltaproteobacteria bacterium]|nr:TAT-variant-translocated molybdopterin oxidoreductase [Deltaproteobacteria bacterium]
MSSMKHGSDTPYWRSLDELAGSPAFEDFMRREFPDVPQTEDPWGSRRRFLQLMGASLSLATGAAACRWPKEEILPFARTPAGAVPGMTRYFATSMEIDGAAVGQLVASYDGRPIKIEGNPAHPASLGASTAVGQAAVLGLYDPDRSQSVTRFEGARAVRQTWEEWTAALAPILAALEQGGGAGLRILSEASSSPTLARLMGDLRARFPQADWIEYSPISRDHERAGAKLAFGQAYRAHYAVEKADVIVCLDDDLLDAHPDAIRHAREHARRRRPENGKVSRLYAIESGFSVTGASADHRLPLRSDQIGAFLLALEARVTGGAAPSGGALGEPKVQKLLAALAKELSAAKGRSLVTVGLAQPAAVHAVAHRLNAALGNAGVTVSYSLPDRSDRRGDLEGLKALAAEMQAGRVKTLIILGGNPVYDAPADLELAAALAKVETSVHLSLYADETSRASKWHLPLSHYLESWGDARAWDGTLSLVQPLIAPLYPTKSMIEVVALLAKSAATDGHALVRETFNRSGNGTDAAWQTALHEGVIAGTAYAVSAPAVAAFESPAPKADAQGLELVFRRDTKVHDGRFANNGWLQEVPDYLTKVAWDNALLVSVETAKQLGVAQADMVKLEVNGRSLILPVYVLPGQANGSLGLALGYGRTEAGNVGGMTRVDVGVVGFDANKVRTVDGFYLASGAKVTKTGGTHVFALTQDHFALDKTGAKGLADRLPALIREGTVEEYEKDPHFVDHVVHHPPLRSLWKEWEYQGNKWGLAIDLSTCTGCNACVVACQAENNIPIVGKEQVAKGREMHWIRIDRYFKGDPSDPVVAHQPVGCMQCENAPCEAVCPVGATMHSSEGLNDMSYNRCFGTRYCSNNCPYKVRRFNYLNFHKRYENPGQGKEILWMVHNPEVTVRHRGVMEKCTYCVQRIQHAKIQAKNEGRKLTDGEIVSACAQACPTEAIVFGDLNDKDSRVAKHHAAPRHYALLEEFNTKPRTHYLAKIRNPNPELG